MAKLVMDWTLTVEVPDTEDASDLTIQQGYRDQIHDLLAQHDIEAEIETTFIEHDEE